jgi:muramoyltetrapeptide carboxypeptidase LdcA involved in peptidoglycan recycling
MVYPQKLHRGDKVAILSPSRGLPEVFPEVFDLGLQRLQEHFELLPVEYPTTRVLHSSLQDRARDVHTAFADPEIKAIICSIGGDDQIKLLKYLDPSLIVSHPKIFMGFSDATNLSIFLWNLGIVSYYGGAIMTQFGMHGAMHAYTLASLEHALFESGEREILASEECTDESLDWSNPELLKQFRPMFPNEGWKWVNDNRVIEGKTWGGCLESIDFNLRAGKHILNNEMYQDKVLFFETSEELPSADYVYRVLMSMGERGMLECFSAILVGRPKAWEFGKPNTIEEKKIYTRAQEEGIQKAVSEYNPDALVVFNMDIGHTDPQCILPNGGNIRIDGIQHRIFVTY